MMSQQQRVPFMAYNSIVVRSEIPYYSSRLNKKLLDDVTSSRLIKYLASDDKKLVIEAINILLTRSYQGKLLFSTQLNVHFDQKQYKSPTLFDALLHTIVKIQGFSVEGGQKQIFKLKIDNNKGELIDKTVAILRNAILQQPNDIVIATSPTAVVALLEILFNYFRIKTSITSILDHQQGLESWNLDTASVPQISSNTPKYILEIFSKIAKKLPLNINNNINNNNINNNNINIVANGNTATNNNNNNNNNNNVNGNGNGNGNGNENNNNNNNNNEQTTPTTTTTEQQQQQQPIDQQEKEQLPFNTFNQEDITYVYFNDGTVQEPVLKVLPSGTAKRLLEILEMALFVYDNDEALMACVETLESVSKPSSFKPLVDEVLLKPIYEPLFETIVSTISSPLLPESSNGTGVTSPIAQTPTGQHQMTASTTTSTTNSSSNSSVNTPVTPMVSTILHLKQSPVVLHKRTFIDRLIELLGHPNNDIQLSSLNVIYNLIKTSQKSRIMICHISGLVRHVCNLLSYKPGDHQMEMGKKAATLLSYFSREQLNIPVLLQFETLLTQIALSDNPHTEIVTNILIKLETTK
ncbi:hypothetical protein DFA_10916 [Cavenderia fasciculata]|uniref:Armadillo-like helical domain-containing protein n=1 Tax=Cavenderia fasciculata TaxID=261658 RepID=F4QBS0_CACFS|nr:uncharacterized protein DFA_10916 [Cavenderia fasciculata]EGG14658.1 hypothetical protein DFA_10916 [Cavenderia fasciculata]|eukprot:XP_004351166.1 hypothetical protein DFA_10916 [Cavenderia fasciculata]